MVANPDPIGLGDLLTYTLTVTNRRSVDAPGVALLMPVPEGLYSTAGCRAVTDGGTVPAACTAGRDKVGRAGWREGGGSWGVEFVGVVKVAVLADGGLVSPAGRWVARAGQALWRGRRR